MNRMEEYLQDQCQMDSPAERTRTRLRAALELGFLTQAEFEHLETEGLAVDPPICAPKDRLSRGAGKFGSVGASADEVTWPETGTVVGASLPHPEHQRTSNPNDASAPRNPVHERPMKAIESPLTLCPSAVPDPDG